MIASLIAAPGDGRTPIEGTNLQLFPPSFTVLWFYVGVMRKFKITYLAILCAGMAARGQAEPLTIDYTKSDIQVAVDSTLHSFSGHLDKYTAEVDATESSNNLPTKAEVSFDFADLKTGDKGRDADMLKWLDHDKFPTATFHLTGWEKDGDTNYALGELTIHGVKQSLKMPVAVTQTGGVWDIAGEVDLDYRNFSLPKIRKMLMLTVDPHLRVAFHLVGQAAATK